MNDSPKPDFPSAIFNLRSPWHLAFLGFLFLLAVVIRLDEIRAPGHLPDREFGAAMFARSFYFADNDSIEPWRRELAITSRKMQPILEPPLTDLMVSWIYRIMGREEVWFARVLTNSFWILGSLFFYLLARSLVSRDAALIATGYYLFVPMGIEIGRSFQPDALMMLTYLASLFLIVRTFQTRLWKHLLLAGILTGLALLIRPLVFFTLLGAFLAMAVYTRLIAPEESTGGQTGRERFKPAHLLRLIDRQTIVFGLLALLPCTLYYGYGMFIAGFMNWKIADSFRPYLFVKPELWRGWLDLSSSVAGQAMLILALAGSTLLKKGLLKALMAGLTAGYVIFLLVFTYHTYTHPYYHIQLFPMVGICAALVIEKAAQALKASGDKRWQALAVVLVLLAVYFSWREYRVRLYTRNMEDPAVAREIGEAVNHSTRTVFVSYYYGVPLQYAAELTGAPWPVSIEDPFFRAPGERERSVAERIASLGFEPEYFVITNLTLYDRKHQDLKEYLEQQCVLTRETDQYLIYSTCRKLIDQ